MKKVEVIKINRYLYTLKDTEGNEYIKNLGFFDTKVEVGDYIYFPNEVLDTNDFYTYGPIDNNATVDDLIKIVRSNKEIYLQKYYG